MNELEQLAAQQAREDSTYQDPQRFAGKRTVSLQPFVDAGMDYPDDVEMRTDQHVWRQNRAHLVHRPRTVQERDALFRACEDLLTSLPTDKEQTVRTVVYEQLSQREAGDRYGVSQPAIFKRLRTSFAVMRAALEDRSGSAGMDFPPTRDLGPGCRAPKCEGHFAEAPCDVDGCITILPRHYNPHTACRIHTGDRTRAEFNLAFILGAVSRGGLDDRSATALNIEAVAS